MPDLLREILLFENSYRLRAGTTKEQQIRERFDFSPYTYRRLLKQALAHPAATSIVTPAIRNKWSSRDPK